MNRGTFSSSRRVHQRGAISVAFALVLSLVSAVERERRLELESGATGAESLRLQIHLGVPGEMKYGILDVSERVFVLGLYGALVVRIVDAIRADGFGLGNLLLLPSEGLVFLFILFRRGTRHVSSRPFDWALALTATAAPMLVRACPERALVPEFAAAVVLMTGTLVQLHAKCVLGRSFGCIPAHRGLKETGPYRFVRHPMYAGYMLSHLAFLLMNASAWNAGLYVVCTLLQIPRLASEERLLALDEGYQRYRARVRHRLIPGVY